MCTQKLFAFFAVISFCTFTGCTPAQQQQAPERTEVAQIPATQISVLPSPTPIPPTLEPTSTNMPSPTPTEVPHSATPTATEIPVTSTPNNRAITQQWFLDLLTASAAPTQLPTRTPVASAISKRSSTPETSDVQTRVETQTVYALSNLNVRRCAATTCGILGSLSVGDEVQTRSSLTGERVSGSNDIWYEIQFRGEVGYIYSQNVSSQRPSANPNPAPAPTQPPVQQSSQADTAPVSTAVVPPTPFPTEAPAISTVPPPPPPAGGSPYTCNGMDDLNCSNFSSRAQAQAHYNLCGNEDRLDGNDNDGLACESLP